MMRNLSYLRKPGAVRRLAVMMLLLGCGAGSAWAWNAQGHQLVALIASDHLTSATEAAITDLLGTATLPQVAAWADDERRRKPETANWHYIDWQVANGRLPASMVGTGTVIDALSSQSAILADHSAARKARVEALKYVVHFVGDIHQPCHAADNYDKGGNDVGVIIDGKTMSLHRAWDFAFLDRLLRGTTAAGTSYSLRAAAGAFEYACAAETSATLRPDGIGGGPLAWGRESHEIAGAAVWSEPWLRANHTTETLQQAYVDRAMRITERQMIRGGWRLAALLNAIFDSAYGGAPKLAPWRGEEAVAKLP